METYLLWYFGPDEMIPDQLYIINMMYNDVQVSEYLCPSTVQMETPHFVLSMFSFS